MLTDIAADSSDECAHIAERLYTVCDVMDQWTVTTHSPCVNNYTGHYTVSCRGMLQIDGIQAGLNLCRYCPVGTVYRQFLLSKAIRCAV